MDNLYFKKLPGTVLPNVTGSDVVIAEASNGTLNWIDASGSKELAAGRFTDANGAANYISKNLNLTLTTGTHIITNCTGTVTVSGNNMTVYISNSPKLTVNGITLDNWDKVYRDGVASYTYPLNIIKQFDAIKTNEVINTEVVSSAYRADKRVLRYSISQPSYTSFAAELSLSFDNNGYNGAAVYNLSNGAANFPMWASVSFAISNTGINGFRFALAPYANASNFQVTLQELYFEKRS